MDHYVKDPNISSRLWVQTYWHSDGKVFHMVDKGDGAEYLTLEPVGSMNDAPARQVIWIECDHKPFRVKHQGITYDFTKYQDEVCRRVFGRTLVPLHATNRNYYNTVLAHCLKESRSSDVGVTYAGINKCFLFNGLNPVRQGMGLAPAMAH